MTENPSTDYLIKNAIGCWLHYFPDHKWTAAYQQLAKEEFTKVTKSDAKPTTKPVHKHSPRTRLKKAE